MKIKKHKIYFILILVLLICILFILNYTSILEKYENINTTHSILPYDIVIVGCARDIESHLANTKKKLEMIKSLFRSSKIIIYENDSKDKTLELLTAWKNEHFIELITEKNVPGIRTERLAYARNVLYKEAMKTNFDLLIVIDLDDVISDLTLESMMSCFNKELIEDWAMIGANQTSKYYDMFALKTYDDWMNIDLMKCRHIDKLPENFCLTDRYKIIQPNEKPIQVLSCFGGTAIYKRKYLDNCDYGKGFQMNGDTKIEFCEHVDFNQCVINNGGKIFINPKFINH
jgi:hypothetical protein